MARTKTSFSKENPKPGPGRPKLTEEKRRQAQIQRAVDYDFKEHCRRLLPMATDLLQGEIEKKRFKGAEAVRVVESLRDTLHGKPAQTIQGPGGGPLIGSFTVLLAAIDGSRVEKIADPTEHQLL